MQAKEITQDQCVSICNIALYICTCTCMAL